MNCLDRLGKATAIAERLISEKMKDPSYKPVSYQQLRQGSSAQIRPTVHFGQATTQHVSRGMKEPDAGLGLNDRTVRGAFGSTGQAYPGIGDACLSFPPSNIQWDTVVFDHRGQANEKPTNNIVCPSLGDTIIEFDALPNGKEGGIHGSEAGADREARREHADVQDQTVGGGHGWKPRVGRASFNHAYQGKLMLETRTVSGGKSEGADTDADILFKAEARKKLDALDKLIEGTKGIATAKKQRNNGLMGTFKGLIESSRSSAASEPSEASMEASVASSASNKSQNKLASGSAIDSAAALATVVRSDGFRKYLDRQIVSSISRIEGFKGHYNKILEAEDVRSIVEMHQGLALRSIRELAEAGDGVASCEEYKNLEAWIRQKDRNRLNASRENGHGPGYQTEVGVQLARYQNMLEMIVESINKGNLECDCRFLRLINRTICKLGAYDDPVVTKMTVQFVVCKRYVEDYVKIKRTVKNFTGCDL